MPPRQAKKKEVATADRPVTKTKAKGAVKKAVKTKRPAGTIIEGSEMPYEQVVSKLRQLDGLREHGNDAAATKLELELHAARVYMHNQNTGQAAQKQQTAYVPYPETSDPHFYERLLAKKELREHAYADTTDARQTYNELADEQCGTTSFELTPNQKFLKRFISPRTPYNSLLLFHGVGVGKTCSAISIAEQFLALTRRRRVLVLLPSALLKDNFRRQVFDVDKDPAQQCAGQAYAAMIPGRHLLTKAVLERRISRHISERYRFMGFIELANEVDRMRRDAADDAGPGAQDAAVEARLAARLRAEFSNYIIIIDEVHNLRLDSEATRKRVPPILERVLRAARNVKLLLMTATPMFNDPREMVYLANLMLNNEKRPPLSISSLFDRNGELRGPAAEASLRTALRGCVSYMRGENPYSFPSRIYPSVNKDRRVLLDKNAPQLDIRGEPIPEHLRLRGLDIVASKMRGEQLELYREADAAFGGVVEGGSVRSGSSDDDAQEEDSFELQVCVQISNIVYPVGGGYRASYGETGFWGCFERVRGGPGALRVTYRPGFEGLLSQPRLESASAKIAAIVEYVRRCRGIAFVYSNWKWSGVIPLAIALEHAGFAKYGGNNLLQGGGQGAGSGTAGRYVIISGDRELSPDNEAEVRVVRSAANLRGEQVRVVLATSVATEGVDFRGIREIHLLEPWFHMNKVEQIVGRAARHCSHAALPPEERNVTIYHHAAIVPPPSPRETLDLRLYRISQNKQERIRRVERILQEVAVDCALNAPALRRGAGSVLDMVTSQGTRLAAHPLSPPEGAQIRCEGKVPAHVDASTFTPRDYSDEVRRYVGIIGGMFRTAPRAVRYREIHDHVAHKLGKRGVAKVSEEVLALALQDMLDTQAQVQGPGDASGYIVYAGDAYVFQPASVRSRRIPLQDRDPVANRPLARLQMQQAAPAPAPAAAAAEQDELDGDHMHRPGPAMHVLGERVSQLLSSLGGAKLPAGMGMLVEDMAVDRLSQSDFVALAARCMPQPAPGDTEARVFMDSLLRGHMVAVDARGQVRFIAVPHEGSAWYTRHGKVVTRASDLELRENVDLLRSARPALPAGATLRSFAAFLVPPAADADAGAAGAAGARFKIMGSGTRSKGFVCEQTATLKVSALRGLIDELDESLLGAVLAAAAAKGRGARGPDKRDLCLSYELALRSVGRLARPHVYNVLSAEASMTATAAPAARRKKR